MGAKPWRKVDSLSRPSAITFTEEDDEGVAPGHDNPMVVIGVIAKAMVKRIFLDQGSSADILFMDAFKQLEILKEDIKPFRTDLVGFSRGKIRPEGYVELYLTMEEEEKRDDSRVKKTVKVKFIVMDCPSAYNVILGKQLLNALGAIISTQYLAMKFVDNHGRIATVREDQAQGRQCYIHSLEVHADPTEQTARPRKEGRKEEAEEKRGMERSKGKEKVGSSIMLTKLDVRDEVADMRSQPEGNLEDFQIGNCPEQTTRIGADQLKPTKSEIKAVMLKNKDLFTWTAADMSDIDPDFICHRLSIVEGSKPVSQRKRKMGPERQK